MSVGFRYLLQKSPFCHERLSGHYNQNNSVLFLREISLFYLLWIRPVRFRHINHMIYLVRSEFLIVWIMKEWGTHIQSKENLPSKIQWYICFKVAVSNLQVPQTFVLRIYPTAIGTPTAKHLFLFPTSPPNDSLIFLIKHPSSPVWILPECLEPKKRTLLLVLWVHQSFGNYLSSRFGSPTHLFWNICTGLPSHNPNPVSSCLFWKQVLQRKFKWFNTCNKLLQKLSV